MDADYKRAADWLENYQARSYERLGIEPDVQPGPGTPFFEKFVREMYEKVVTQQRGISFEVFYQQAVESDRKAREAVPTRYEDPHWYALILGFAAQIEEELRELGHTLTQRPLFGTLPTGRVNGMAIALPDCAYRIILLESGLFGFANLATKAVAHTFPPAGKGDKEGGLSFRTDDAGWQAEIKANPALAERVLDLLGAYLIGGHPHAARPYLPNPKVEPLSSLLRNSMELFVLSHEYGHCISGHLDDAMPHRPTTADPDVEQVVTNWKQEFEADARGLELMINAMSRRRIDISLSYSGADFFFGCIELVQNALCVLRTGRRPTEEEVMSHTHPPPATRREALRNVVRRSVPENVAEAAIGLAETFDRMLATYWALCEPALAEMHRDGVEVAPSWRIH
jgi:hypothetical protein